MGFYGNLMHKYKKNEITILKGTICSAIIYFLTIYRFLILIKKINIVITKKKFFILINLNYSVLQLTLKYKLVNTIKSPVIPKIIYSVMRVSPNSTS